MKIKDKFGTRMMLQCLSLLGFKLFMASRVLLGFYVRLLGFFFSLNPRGNDVALFMFENLLDIYCVVVFVFCQTRL